MSLHYFVGSGVYKTEQGHYLTLSKQEYFSQPGASNDPPGPHYDLLFVAPWWRGFKALLSQCVPFSLIDSIGCRESFLCLRSFSFLSSQQLQLHIKPNGHGHTNIINRAELAGTLETLQQGHTEIVSNSVSKNTRPGAQLKASQQPHNELCRQLQGKGDALAQKSRESPPPQSYKAEHANGDLEDDWKQLAPESDCENFCFVFNSTPSGDKLIDVRNRVGVKFASKLNGTLVVVYQFKPPMAKMQSNKNQYPPYNPARLKLRIMWEYSEYYK
eukprot:1160316-Pelagomonas_calceolata.AAC.9